MHLSIAGLTDIGRVRTENEDAFFINDTLAVVADGMGGAAAGEIASSLAVNIIAAALKDAAPGSDAEAEKLIRNSILEADAQIRSAAKANWSFSGMGTTLLVALPVKQHILLGHVGDSRAYFISGGYARGIEAINSSRENVAVSATPRQTGSAETSSPFIMRLTDDHSVVMEMVRLGMLSEKEIRSHPLRNRITRCVGCLEDQEPDFLKFTPRKGDVLILCTDGLWEMVHENKILKIVASAESPENMCRKLIDAANAAGGQDNITAVAEAFD